MPRVKIPLLFLLALLAAAFVCAPAWGAEVSGITVDAANHQGKFVPANLVDGDPSTAWVGGGKGIGPGKWIEFSFPADVKLESLTIVNGHQGKGQFKKFRRLTKGVILYADGTRQKFVLKPAAGRQKLKLQPRTVRSFKIIITGVAPGSKDKSMGKAKVAVSEIAVFGEMAEPAKPQEKVEAVVVTDTVEAAKKAAPRKPEPEKAAKPEPKPAPKPKPAKAAPVKVEKKAVAKPEKKATQPKAKAKAKPKKTAPKKPAPKKTVAKAKPKKKAAPSAPAGSITHLRPSTEVPIDKPLDIGVISPWLDLEFVAQIKRYFALLTTLHDSYPDVFVASIRDRERGAFIRLQDAMRAKKQFGRHHIAMLEHIGLNFDKPVISGNSATVRAHGPYRYYIENQAFEFLVDTVFSFEKENGKWLLSGVQDK